MSSSRVEQARELVRTYLEVEEGGQLPRTAVTDLMILAGWVDQTLRTAVLDRRMSVDTWAEIADDLGVSQQAARKKYTAPGHPRRSGELSAYPDRDAYYADRQDLATVWGYAPGEVGRGTAPMGSDETGIEAAGEHWSLTVSTEPGNLRFDSWRRVGRPLHTALGDVVATSWKTGAVVVVAHEVPIGPAARALKTIQGTGDLQDVADAIATECGRPDAVQPSVGGKCRSQ